VLLQLRPGNRLQSEQVSAIVHLVASSIPELDSDNVTVVDQQGRLLSSPKNSEAAITAEQFEAAHRVEDNYIEHIEKLIAPLVGDGRVHAQVTVDLDAGATEEAHEQYKPDSAIVRSEQSAEEISRSGSSASGGIPGALTNQPPSGGTATAVNTKPAAPAAGAAGAKGAAATAAAAADSAAAATTTPENTSKQSTRNYEIDRTVSYSRQPAGRVKRVTVAVLVDNMRQVGADGKAAERPLTKAEMDDITRLVKDAVGFDEARGDSVNVVNQPLQPQVVETLKPEVIPLWQRPWIRDVMRLVLGALVLVALALGVLRPLIKNLSTHALSSAAPELLSGGARAQDDRPIVSAAPGQPLAYEQQLVQARGLVTQDAKRVAQVVKTWVGEQ
jgi:flagellar M-ring protein FliF